MVHGRRPRVRPLRPDPLGLTGAGRAPLVRAVGVGAVLVLAVALRLPFLDLPLNRDEGEYAYVAQRLLQGVPPYGEAYSLRWPGIYAAYAAILAVLGRSHVAVHLGLTVANAATVALVMRLGGRLFDPAVGLAAGALYAVLSINRYLLGFAGYTEHFVVLPALAALVLLVGTVQPVGTRRAFWAGTLLGAATLVKQPGVFFLLLGFVLIAWDARRRAAAPLAAFTAGAAWPAAVTVIALGAAGVLERGWFWTVRYAAEYVGLREAATVPRVLAETLGPLVGTAGGPLALAAVGVVALAAGAGAGRGRRVVVGLAVAGAAATSVGLYFRPHYFILLLPALALLGGVGATALARRLFARDRWAAIAATALTAIAVALSVVAQRDVLIGVTPHALAHELYHGNPYPEALQIGRMLRDLTPAGARIAVIGSEPEIYFYADRPAATAFIYMYPLMERQPFARAMQEEMIGQVETARPAYVVVVWVNYSWMASAQSDQRVFRWLEDYRRRHLDRVGVVDIVAPDHSEYRWGAEAAGYTPRARFWLEILRRRTAGS